MPVKSPGHRKGGRAQLTIRQKVSRITELGDDKEEDDFVVPGTHVSVRSDADDKEEEVKMGENEEK